MLCITPILRRLEQMYGTRTEEKIKKQNDLDQNGKREAEAIARENLHNESGIHRMGAG